jgi:hypothetical protein
MTISQFFEKTLRAKLRNNVWSWGATDAYNRIFLRVWKDNIKRDAAGERVKVFFKERAPGRQSNGVAEREIHIAAMKRGAEAFGILCWPEVAHRDPTTRRNISDFDPKALLRLGSITEENGDIYAAILERIPIEEWAKKRSEMKV